eukprot:1396593-Rhodomonas_salina.3
MRCADGASQYHTFHSAHVVSVPHTIAQYKPGCSGGSSSSYQTSRRDCVDRDTGQAIHYRSTGHRVGMAKADTWSRSLLVRCRQKAATW